ncbi:MAG: alkane 1-monooxygenase [Planctomyces sp.]|jgi:alkanesulfonate monooxygenase SsuD/methylene tetrahydromethanopterin reductase-like flavin-dependent oxidoreductase (luciferase family)|nr:alkane 1-monooxygenase [Planctomyces sp.]
MEFGLFMMPLHPPHRSIADSYDRDLDLLAHADRLGYHEAWIGEHITESWENAPVPELLVAKALAMTQNIIMGTGVTLLSIHNPVEVAHRIAMLDHLARGRFYWGVGARALPTDLQLYGFDPTKAEETRERSKEALEVILGLWSAEGGYDHEGKYFQIHAPEMNPELERGLYMKPYQKPHPPVGVAGSTPGSPSIRLAGEKGWIPMSSSNLLPKYLAQQWDVIEEGAASAGRTPDRKEWRIARDVYVADTPEQARKEARELLGRNYVQHQFPNRKAARNLAGSKVDPEMPDEAVDVDYMMENVWVVGDPDECAEKIRNIYDEVGGFGSFLAISQDPDIAEQSSHCLELLIKEVGPKIKDLTGA